MTGPSVVAWTRWSIHSSGRVAAGLLVAALAAGFTSACVNPTTVLTRLVEARRLTSDLHVAFTKAADAANRAVMADTDEASIDAADEARRANAAVERDVDALRPVLAIARLQRRRASSRRVHGTIRRVPADSTTRSCRSPSRTRT